MEFEVRPPLHFTFTLLSLQQLTKPFLFRNYITSVEEQAMDRVHRIGQTKPVSVVKYVMDGSIEERILAIQEKKQLMNKGALGKLSSAEIRKARLADLRSIFSE